VYAALEVFVDALRDEKGRQIAEVLAIKRDSGALDLQRRVHYLEGLLRAHGIPFKEKTP
jgi:hypothetical protein